MSEKGATDAGGSKRKLFLSYGWKDDQPFVKRLYDDLKKRDWDPWMDVHNMPSRGRTLPQEVIDNLSDCERVIAVIGPGWLSSPACQAEKEFAIEIGKVINPVLRSRELSFGELPTDLKKFLVVNFQSGQNYEDALEELLRVIAQPAAPAGRLFGVPGLPANYQLRPADLQSVRDAMEIKDLKPVAILSANHNVALQGMSGVGKTVLATAYAHDYEARRSFPDGIVWLSVRREPNLVSLIHQVGSALRANLDRYTEVNQAKAHLQAALEDKECLLVLDDVWDLDIAQTFLEALGARCRLLLTTRDGSVANKLKAHVWRVDRLDDKTARSLLAESAGVAVDTLPLEANGVLQECGNLPYPLAQCGATIRNGNSWHDLLDALRHADVSYIAERLPNYEYTDVFKSIQVSVDFLARQDPSAAKRYLELAVFPAKQVPEAAAVTLWTRDGDLSEAHARKLLTTLYNVALVEHLEGESPRRRFSLHDLQLDYVQAAVGDLSQLHEELLSAYRKKCQDGWPTGPNDGYFFQYLPYHMQEAGSAGELRSLLLSPEWLQVKLATTDATSLTADFDHLPNDQDLQLIQGAIRLSSNVIGQDSNQFASQMVGRLLHKNVPAIEEFIKRICKCTHAPWLRSLQPTLHPPGTGLVRTLTGHSSGVSHLTGISAVAVTPDGLRAISASEDKTLKVWDLSSGIQVSAFTGHSGWVTALAVMPDGQRVISGSNDQTLKMWDLSSGCQLRTLKVHSIVTGVAVTEDGQHAVLASDDKTLKVWDLLSGRRMRTLAGHTDRVVAVALTPDGKQAVSASWDHTLKVWDLSSGRELHTLTGHTHWVTAVAVTPDGQRAVSASDDGTLKVWDLGRGVELRTLAGHTDGVTAVAVTPDGQHVVSGSRDRTLKVWGLASGKEQCTLAGHSNPIWAVAVTPGGRCVLSASEDRTLKLWELRSGASLRRSPGHLNSVNAVRVTADGRVVSMSDQTLIVWDLGSGRDLFTLTISSDSVDAVAVTPDGLRAISASEDKTLKVWDLSSGVELSTFTGHSGWVTALAVMPDGQRVISGSDDQTLKMWDLSSGCQLRTLKVDSTVTGVAVTEDGQHAVLASDNKTLKVWDLLSGRKMRTLAGHTDRVVAVALTPDGKQAVSASWDHTLKVWDLSSGRELHTLTGHRDSVQAVAVVPDGQRAASGSWDHTLKVWDLESGRCLATFTCDDAVSSCAFADNCTLIAGDEGGCVHFLKFENTELHDQFGNMVEV